MKTLIAASFALVAFTSVTQAAGVKATLKITVDETKLQGYAATPPAGYMQHFAYGVATPTTAATQALFVVSAQVYAGAPSPTVLPTPAAINIISLANVSLFKDNLPAAAQLTKADCTLPNSLTRLYNVCPILSVQIFSLKSLPGKYLIIAIKTLFDKATNRFTPFKAIYILDPNGAAGSTDRWFLWSTSTGLAYDELAFAGINEINTYQFKRISNIATQIYQITSK